MRRVTLIVLSLAVFADFSHAQELSLKRTTGFVFIAPGAVTAGRDASATVHAGAGADVRIYKGLTAGAELGGIGGGDKLAIFSSNVSYRFLNATQSRKLVPYLTAGYTAAVTGEVGENWFNVGGGIDYWIGQRTGVRLEFRDQADPNHSQLWHFLEGRVAFIWR
jgi:hypothetical protein